tara:strand:+ start:5048 stop:5461 length:414 start_codon:yes stop_codon:yes gene_type:complete
MAKTKEPSIHQKKREYRFLDKFLSKVKNLDNPVYQEMIKYKDQLGKETGLGRPIEERLRSFLVEHHLPLHFVPTISHMGKYKGGYALVREIAMDHGGMKKVKELYAKKYSIGPNHDTLEEMLVRHNIYLWDEEEFIA